MRLVNTGIAAARAHGPVGPGRARDGSFVAGLYAIGEAAGRTTGGVGYNSGYSLSRALTYGWLAAHDVAGVESGNDETRLVAGFRGTATGIRTPVSAVRGRRPSPLDDSGRNRRQG